MTFSAFLSASVNLQFQESTDSGLLVNVREKLINSAPAWNPKLYNYIANKK